MIIIFIQETNITRSVSQMVPANIKIQSIENIYSVRAVFTYWYIWIYMIYQKNYETIGYMMLYVIYEQRERVFHRDIQTRENNV
jgi:hypothetical protein